MAAKEKTPYWQICMTCDRREYAAEPATCRTCGSNMIDVLEHPDNAHRKQPSPPAKPGPKPIGQA